MCKVSIAELAGVILVEPVVVLMVLFQEQEIIIVAQGLLASQPYNDSADSMNWRD